MAGMIAITFALPEESRDFAHALHHAGSFGPPDCPMLLGNLGPQEVLIVHTGMGEARTRERLIPFFENHPVERVISAGYAGGLDPLLPTGTLFLAENYSSPEWLARARALFQNRSRVGTLATAPAALETCQAKAALARRTGALAVDMETAAIAALCREKGIPLLSLRAISDNAREELAVPFSICFDAEKQRPRPFALVKFLLRHPSRLPGFIRFVAGVNLARRVLTHALVELVETPAAEIASAPASPSAPSPPSGLFPG